MESFVDREPGAGESQEGSGKPLHKYAGPSSWQQTPQDTLSPEQILCRYGKPGMRFLRASTARLLVNASEAFPQMLAAIDAAAAQVSLETYTLRDDRAGQAFQQALIRAAGRGVHVRLLFDWIGSFSLSRTFVQQLLDAEVDVAAFHPLLVPRPVWALNKRDHRKILVVDDAVGFTGGLNLGEEYYPVSAGGQGWRDTHLGLEGPAVARALRDLFEEAWRQATPYGATCSRRTRFKYTLQRRWTSLWRRKDRLPPTAVVSQGVPVSLIGNQLLRQRWRIHRAYLRAIRRATRYVLIENAYFIPNRSFRQALLAAARRGVFVAVVVSAASDVPITDYASRRLYDELLRGGVHLFAWPHSVMHAKTAVIDDVWSIVGSYNFDHRSLLHQLECVAVIADPGFAVGLRRQTLDDLARCQEISLAAHRQRPRWQRLLESLAYLLRHWL